MVDYKKIGIHVAIISKETNEIVAKGVLVAFKDLPVLSISFDFKYFFNTMENPLFRIEVVADEDIVIFDKEKYKDWIHPYKGLSERDYTKEYVYREFDINELDPEVAPLVYILNEIGYVTTGSCCGHGLSVGWVHISFTDFKMLRELALIVYRDEFKSRFTLSTDSNVSNMGPTEIRLSLNTIAKGEQAYKDMSDLVVYLKSKKERLKRLRELKN